MSRLVFCLLALSVGARAFTQDLTGVWLFEKEVDTRADGSLIDLSLPAYDGVLIYTADGFVSATIMPRDRKWDIGSASRADFLGSIGEGAATAYAGRYVVDTAAKTVTHLPITSVDPGDVGKELVRQYSRTGDKLLLSGKFRHEGRELTFTVHWRRAPAPGKT